MKKTLRLVAVLFLALLVSSCGTNKKPAKETKAEKLVVWTFTDEVSDMVQDYYLKEYPDLGYEIEIVKTPSDQFQTKLDPILGTDKAPDVIALEASFVKKYVESGLLADLDEFDLTKKSKNMYEYVREVGTSKDNVLRALSWQATPGAFFYRKSLADEYLGGSSPEEIQALVSDFDKFHETAIKLKEASNGEVYMVSSVGDLLYPFAALRETGWVENETLMMDEKMIELMDLAKILVDEKLTLDTEYRSEAWYAGMSSNNIFGYALPTWGLHYWLQPNSEASSGGESTFGDWRMVQGPAHYFSGGTWLGVTDTSTVKAEAAQLIDFITNNEDFLAAYAKKVGDVVSNRVVVEAIKSDFSNDFLGGQNHYEEFATMIEGISAKTFTENDRTITTLYQDEALVPYSKGEIDKETAIANFKAAVLNSYPDLQVD